MDKIKRWWVQFFATIVTNANLKGFKTGTIYTGKLKMGCCPGLNCYSCPAAVSS